MKFYGENVDLILDEFSSLCEQMTSTMTMDDMYGVGNQILRELIKSASRVQNGDQEKGFHGMCMTKNTSEASKRDIVKNISPHIANFNYSIHTPTISMGIDNNVIKV
ncbi:hypothetical protein BCR41DRAFT_391776 [Lobosporangium transversale]|uniref:Uncharacterized protein n=1 Tax=Lobosporangium transversale TaxID=64571 RepID=A0A1Y2H174_9FUNG|nr:hypothetical protein BCR41DRAFT_391776 [Lobosporangium transversale]ORZ28300.1 hypothetical protein BCR41DRAFT_391776 [Lobosporangium transversale]|eukprot:XP_021885985.1 hypothetical protein BCR41DRAFT_391776 [Lobosporangium transversale]